MNADQRPAIESDAAEVTDRPAEQQQQQQQLQEASTEVLQARLNSLEAEFLNAWATLELLSAEYLAMWERLETVELLLYQQQATIARLVSSAASATGATEADDEEFTAKVAAQLRLLESASSSTAPVPPSQAVRSRLSADEAFYRSLNSAHRESPSLVSESDNELRMIWESGQVNEGNVFSAEDYLHYNRRRSQQLQPLTEDDWSRRKTSPTALVEQEQRLSRRLKKDRIALEEKIQQQQLQQSRGTVAKTEESSSSELLHEQLRLAFLESARQKSMRNKTPAVGTTAAAGATAAAPPPPPPPLLPPPPPPPLPPPLAAAAVLTTPVDIDPLHLGRSNSSENISPSFSSYLRTTPSAAECLPAPANTTGSNPTSPLVRRKNHQHARSSTPQPNNDVNEPDRDLQPPFVKSPVRIKTRSASDETSASSSGKLSKSPSKHRTAASCKRGLSPTRFNRASSTRSDSGVSSLSGNWSSIDQERSPVISPSKLLLAGGTTASHSSSSLLAHTLDPDNNSDGPAPPPPPPAPDVSSSLVFISTSYQDVIKSPSMVLVMQQQQQLQPHMMTTETWNVQGSICSVASSPYLDKSDANCRASRQRVLARHDATWMETDDPYWTPTVLDGDWYSPRGVVRPQQATAHGQHHSYRSNTPSPAPGSVPQGHFVPEPANFHQLEQEQQQQLCPYPTLNYEPCRDELGMMSRTGDYVAQHEEINRRVRHRRSTSSASDGQLQTVIPFQEPQYFPVSPATSTGYVDYQNQPELSGSSSIDYYDLYYQSPPAPQRTHYSHHNHSAAGQEMAEDSYVYRNPLPSYDEMGAGYYGQPTPPEEITRPSPYTSASGQVIVSQGGYISISQQQERQYTATHEQSSPGSQVKSGGGGPRKKIRSAMNQLIPHFSRPTLKNRSVSLPGDVDQAASHDPSSGGAERSKRFFGRTSSLPGMARKGKKMMKQLSGLIGGRIQQNKRPGSLHSLQDDWDGPSARNKTTTVHSNNNHQSRTFVSYCNEGFDLGNDWQQGGAGAVGDDEQEEEEEERVPPGSSGMLMPSSHLIRQHSAGSSSGEFAASRAVGRYRRTLAAAEAAASSASAEPQQQQSHFLPDVTVVSSFDRSLERTASEEETSISLHLDLINRPEEEEQHPTPTTTTNYSVDDFFPKVGPKIVSKKQQQQPEQRQLEMHPPTPDNASENREQAQDVPSELIIPAIAPAASTTMTTTMTISTTTTAMTNSRPAAPRWQSTEESIDMDDEWYRYGMMQLEEMERRASDLGYDAEGMVAAAAREYNQQTSVDNQKTAVLEELKARVPVYDDGAQPTASAVDGDADSELVEQGAEMYYWPTENDPTGEVNWTYPMESAEMAEPDDKCEEYSSGETSGPDTPRHNQSFDEPDEYTEPTEQAEHEEVPSVTPAPSCATVLPTHRHSISGNSRADIFPTGSNILSAAGSTASNIASSVFSFFKGSDDNASTPQQQQQQLQQPQAPPQLDVPTLVEPISHEAEAVLDVPPASASETTAAVAATATGPIDEEHEKVLKLTKGSAARWKLVKTLRDKKAEAASGTSPGASSPVNEAVRRETRGYSSALFSTR